ncbi:MAG: PAS domain S-box protein [Chloroflexi bacterium]|nr:PAS domain S-box protein [Chloroflexota bacterium]
MEEHFSIPTDLLPYARAYESLGDSVTISDPNDSLVFINSAGEELYGYARSELLGRPLSRILPAGAQFVGAEMLRSSPNEKWEGEVTRARKGGEEFPAQLTVTLLRNDDNVVIGTAGIVRDLTGTRRLADDNAVLAEVGRIVGSSLDIDKTYERFAEEVRKLIPFDRMSIDTVDVEAGTRVPAYHTGSTVPGREVGDTYPLEGSSVAAAIGAESGLLRRGAVLDELTSEIPGLRPAVDAGYRSFITVPLVSADAVVGAIVLHHKDPDAYSPHDLGIAGRIGAQIAGAFANSGLNASLQRDAKERAILAEIGRTIGSTLDIDEVYSRFAERAGELIQFDRININLLVSEEEVFTSTHVTGVDIPGHGAGEVTRLTGTFMDTVMLEKAGLIFHPEDRSKLEALYPGLMPGFDAGFRTFLAVPLFSEDRVIGTLHFQSTETDAYSPRDLGLAERMGAQIAGAIANAQLHASLLRESTERETLATIGRIITSTADINEIYRRFAEELRKLISFDRISIGTVDLEAETLTRAYVSGTDVPGWSAGGVFRLSDSVNQRAIRAKKGHLLEWDSERLAPGEQRAQALSLEAGLRSGMTIPLISNGQVIGTFNLRSKESNAYAQKDLALAERVGAQVAGAIANAQLFEERKRAEEALRESEKLYRSLYDNTPVMMHAVDRTGRLVNVNRHWLETLGYERGEAIGRRSTEFLTDSSRRYATEVMSPEFWKTGSARDVEYQMVRKNGEVIDVLLSAVVERDEAGEATQSLAFVVDVTERKRLEEELHQAQKMEAVGTLAGGVAHDFNNMLSAIVGYTDLTLMQSETTEQMRAYLGEALRAADRAAHLTRQLLTFSRHRPVEPRILSLNEIVVTINKMMRRLIRENIELVTLPQHDLELVNVDPGQMEQVLTNMVVNATDAMPDGGKLVIETTNVTVDARLARQHPDLNPGEYVTLRVSDNGTGVDEEVRTRIFEPFYTTKEVGRGTGLGLSICYGIVAQSGGHIAVDSEPGVGSTFTIFLPVATEAAEELPLHDDAGFLPSGSEVVTVVEDEPLVRSATTTVLRQQGYQVIEAANGTEAIRIAQEQTTDIDLLLTDIVMPLMGGAELAERFGELHPEARVLYTSGYTDDPRIRRGPGGTSEPFISKPFTPRELAQKVREVLDAVRPSEGHKRQ